MGSDLYDSSDKRRPPAWCDRVLWWEDATTIRPECGRVDCRAYCCHANHRTSDHRPVSAALTLRVDVPDAAAQRSVHAEILKSVDAWENSCAPSADIDTTDMDLGVVTRGYRGSGSADGMEASTGGGEATGRAEAAKLPSRRVVTLYNSGQTALRYHVQNNPSWLEVDPACNMVMPGERVAIMITVRAPVRVGGAEVQDLEAILVLHLLHGRDFFISVRARLIDPPEPRRVVSTPEGTQGDGSDDDGDNSIHETPQPPA